MKVNNFYKFKESKANKRLIALFLAGILTLGGCSVNSNSDISSQNDTIETSTIQSYDNYDKVFVEIGNKVFDLEIISFTRVDDALTILYLTDGTKLGVCPIDLTMYNSKSEFISSNKDNISSISITTEPSIPQSYDDYDKAFVEVGNSIFDLEINSFIRIDDALTILYLADGTKLGVNPIDLTMYNSNSYIMNQVEDEILIKQMKKN